MLSKMPGNKVEIITSDFNHAAKKHFLQVDELQGIKVSTMHEMGYSKNICFKRFASHRKLSKNIKKFLDERRKPDVCYCAIPSLDVAGVVAEYCKKNCIKFIVDIQDLWPQAFKMFFNIPVISNIGFFPMKMKANRIYAIADEIVAVSETYAKYGMLVNKKCKTSTIVYLGTEMETFDKYAQLIRRPTSEVIVSYIGSLSASYDLETVIEAIARVVAPIRFLIMGDGPYKERFEMYAKEKGVNAEFTGRLDYPEMVKRLVNSDIAINPIHKGSAGSILNKACDYAMAGLPVINTQESPDYRTLLNEYGAGINCECEDADSLVNALNRLIKNDKLRRQMGVNSRKLGIEKFDRKKTYWRIVDKII